MSQLVIGRVVVELRGLRRGAAHTWHRRLARWLDEELAGHIERAVRGLDTGDHLLVPRMVVEAGRSAPFRLEQTLAERTVASVRECLGEARSGTAASSAPADHAPYARRVGGAARGRELLACFLRDGVLPWWAPPTWRVREGVERLLSGTPHGPRILVRALARHPGALRRLALNLTPAQRGPLLERLHAGLQARLLRWQALPGVSRSPATQPALVEGLLDLWARADPALDDADDGGAALLARVVERTVAHPATPGPGITRSPDPAAAPLDSPAPRVPPVPPVSKARLDPPDAARAASGDARAATVAGKGRVRFGGSRAPASAARGPPAPAHPSQGPRRSTGETAEREPQGEGEVARAGRLASVPGTAGHASGSRRVSGAAHRPSHARTGAAPDPRAPPLPDPGTDPGPGAGPGVAVPQAGVVLLWPYLSVLFRTLDLRRDGAFAPGAQARAVHLLHHAATGSAGAEEHELLLPKLLCGHDPSTPIAPEFTPTTRERAEVRALLEATIEHWGALGATSIEGLRSAFLLRPGLLGLEGDEALLRVERRGHDVLLERLPYGLSMVRTSWMTRLLRVEW